MCVREGGKGLETEAMPNMSSGATLNPGVFLMEFRNQELSMKYIYVYILYTKKCSVRVHTYIHVSTLNTNRGRDKGKDRTKGDYFISHTNFLE